MDRDSLKKARFTSTAGIIFVLFFLILLPGCTISGISAPPDDLTAPEWHLIKYTGTDKNSVDALPGTSVTLKFDKNGTFRGSAGCNRFSGLYSVEGELMTVKSLSSTEMYCRDSPGVMDQEQQVLSHLSNSTRFSVNDPYLALSYYDEERLLVFEKG
jgi:heat shock protein HslJ